MPFFFAVLSVFGFLLGTRMPASALPVFAHRYGVTCQTCHTTVPRLNAYGEYFAEHGFARPGAHGAFPVAVKVNLAYGSDPDPAGLPKAIVDEVELLTGGTLGNRTNYFVEQYVVDGGRPGLLRDAWLQLNGDHSHVKIGQFELPLPVQVESERDTLTHYALYDQTVGVNPFSFFDPRIGIDASFGTDEGFAAHILLLHAYDRQSSAPRSGVDLMATAAKTLGDFTLQAYRFQGQRNFATTDKFNRQGYALAYRHARLQFVGVLQTGNDSSADGLGASASSSGGFLESRYEWSEDKSLVARYDATSDMLTGSRRMLILGTVLRPRRNMRFTIEGTTAAGHQALATALLFAY